MRELQNSEYKCNKQDPVGLSLVEGMMTSDLRQVRSVGVEPVL